MSHVEYFKDLQDLSSLRVELLNRYMGKAPMNEDFRMKYMSKTGWISRFIELRNFGEVRIPSYEMDEAIRVLAQGEAELNRLIDSGKI